MTGTVSVRVSGISKRFGSVTALHRVSLEVAAGEFFALLGPSGCGKTTLLRILAGLDHPDEGSVSIDGRDMGRTPANRRPVNMVFQSYAVFPHLSVRDNVAYGLRVSGTGRAAARERAESALELVRLPGYGDRMPHQISGGERQRVALARALVKRPRVLLLDEPLSALDARLRGEMRLELVTLQKTVGITFIIVTHDQEEALSMADRVAVMDGGRIRQIAPPAELYEAPVDRFVAGFIGSINLFAGITRHGPGGTVVETGFPGITLGAGDLPAAKRVWVAVRPEKITIMRRGETGQGSGVRLDGVVEEVSYRGDLSVYRVRVAPGPDRGAPDQGIPDQVVTVSRTNAGRGDGHAPGPGTEVTLGWLAENAVVLTS